MIAIELLVIADAGNEEGLSPLHCAALSGSLESAKLLVEAGCELSVADLQGR